MNPTDFDEYYSGLFKDAFARTAERLDPERLEEAVPRMFEIASDGLVQGLHDRAPEMVAEYRDIRRAFEERLEAHWGRAFDLAQMVMVCAREAGESFNHKHRSAAAPENDLVFFAVVGLHARACRISEEVLALMRAGFGQAAMTRWRALHEVAAVASFIEKHGQETAQRYFAHETIEAWRGMNELQGYAERLSIKPFDPPELQALEQEKEKLRARYGPKFHQPYGWANHALATADPKLANKKVGIGDIEKAAGLDHLRPYYRLASHGVHANPKGITYKPDLLDGDTLLAGASDAGLAEPGHSTLISLLQVTATLLTSKPGEATPIILTALLRLTDEAGEAYLEAHRQLESA